MGDVWGIGWMGQDFPVEALQLLAGRGSDVRPRVAVEELTP
jgi:hypothetical protein